MLNVVHLTNLYFRFGMGLVKWSFQTIYDDVNEKTTYSIITGKRTQEVTKEQGNKIFVWIRCHYKDSKAIVVVSTDVDDVRFMKVLDHYEVYVNGSFKESCDTYSEAVAARQEWISKLKC